MKIRKGFVSNSSSTSFLITNKADKDLDLVAFAKEVLFLVDDFNDQYSHGIKHKDFLKDAKEENITFPAGSTRTQIFGDDDGNSLGLILDYMLRDGGETENFKWKFHESYR